ncbi:hypothetical protein ACB381_23365, partial [Klebsiella michiganensis]
FSKIDTDSSDGHNESLWVNIYPMIARKLIRCISRGSPFHSLNNFIINIIDYLGWIFIFLQSLVLCQFMMKDYKVLKEK